MESDTAKRLIRRVKQLREERGLTQEAFAEEADLKYKHYQAIEAGRKEDIRISTLEKLAKACELDPWELLVPEKLTSMVAEAQGRIQRTPGKHTRRNK